MSGPSSISVRPVSSSSSRRRACSSVSPSSTPPPGVAHQTSPLDGVLEAHEQDAIVGVEDDRAHGRPLGDDEPVVQRLEPLQPLDVRNRGVRGRRRRQHEEPRRRRASGSAGRARAGRRTRRGRPPCRRTRSPAAAARAPPLEAGRVEVAAPQVARAGRRPVRGVRDADAELEQGELLLRVVEPRREAAVVQKPPEVVARIREMRGGRGRDAARVDAAEDAAQVGGEDVRDVRAAWAGHAACSVAHAPSTSPCTPTRWAAVPAGGPSGAGRSAAATSS